MSILLFLVPVALALGHGRRRAGAIGDGVGADAYAAKLAAEASKFTLVHSELQAGINKILRFITWLLIPVGLATIVVQLTLPGVAWNDALLGMAGAPATRRKTAAARRARAD